MATSARLRGNVKPIFTIKKGSAVATSYADDLKKVELTAAKKNDSDITFAEAAEGTGVDWTLKVTTITAAVSTALWAFCWDNRGSEVIITWGPYGNATPSATQPHYQLTAKVPTPSIATEASTDTTKSSSTDLVFEGVSDVTKVTQ